MSERQKNIQIPINTRGMLTRARYPELIRVVTETYVSAAGYQCSGIFARTRFSQA